MASSPGRSYWLSPQKLVTTSHFFRFQPPPPTPKLWLSMSKSLSRHSVSDSPAATASSAGYRIS